MRVVLTVVIAYLLGSISSGVLLSRLIKHDDIRQHGSGNAGTTNMLRVMGRGLALLTLLGDILKGIIAVVIGSALVGGTAGGLLGAIGAVLGHNFPCFFGFKGGKGIATSFGCLLILFPVQSLFAVLVFAVLFVTTHYVSLGSIGAAVALPAAVVLTTPYNPFIWCGVVFLGVLAIIRHKTNIERLLHHKENRIDFSLFRKNK